MNKLLKCPECGADRTKKGRRFTPQTLGIHQSFHQRNGQWTREPEPEPVSPATPAANGDSIVVQALRYKLAETEKQVELLKQVIDML